MQSEPRHKLNWTHLVWAFGLLSWRLTALTPTCKHVSTAVQIRLTHSSSTWFVLLGRLPPTHSDQNTFMCFRQALLYCFFPQNNRFWHDRWRLKFTAWKMSHYDPEEWDKHTHTVSWKHHTFTINEVKQSEFPCWAVTKNPKMPWYCTRYRHTLHVVIITQNLVYCMWPCF